MADSTGSLDPPRRLLMGSGPSNPEPRVLQALTAAPLAPDDPGYAALLDDVSGLARAVFQTANRCTLAVAGASRAGLEATLASLVEPGDRVLVGVYGHFGELLCTLAARHGATVERVDAEWGSPVRPEDIITRVRHKPPKLVAIVHADTSTGILQPLDAIGAVCREAGSLFLVDAVLSLGGCEMDVDGWAVDAAIGGMQKCLGGPPGLAPVTCSDGARAARAGRSTLPHSAYLDLARLEALWSDRQGLHTAAMSTAMLLGAREALRMVLEEGLATRWARHRRASQALRAGLKAMGLELFGDPAHRVPMITLVRVPAEVDEAGVRDQLLREHGIEIMAAFGPLRGRVWRIGTLGTNACLPSVVAVLAALEAVLAAARGSAVPRGAAVDAALLANRQG
ncbi:MAG: alanine--glyoxylate aminotransferase family protein [Chloroflexi bacterium]|nr:alanine--glyoxylate aminotransferase family protein [Chloroflexota bacterium]